MLQQPNTWLTLLWDGVICIEQRVSITGSLVLLCAGTAVLLYHWLAPHLAAVLQADPHLT